MNLKKLLALVLAATLSLTACSGGTSTEAETEAASEATTDSEETEASEEESEEATADETEASEEETEAAGEGEAVEVVFWHAMNGAQEEALVKLTDDFMAENPDITINLQNQSSYDDLSAKLVSTMQSPDDLPTITQAYPDWLLPMDEAGLIVDLDPFINSEDTELAFDNWDDVIEGFRDGVTSEDGRIMGMPFNKSTEVLWYNASLLEELGLEVPTNYDELAEVSRTIYEEKGIPGAGFDSLTNYMPTWLANQGVEFGPDLDVTSEEFSSGVNYYLDGIKEGYFRIAGADGYLSGPMANEQVAMYIGSNAGEGYVAEGVGDKFEYAAAPYPSDEGRALQQGTDIYMFSTGDENVQKAAFQYMKHLTTAENQVYWAIETGYIPVRTSAVESEEYTSSESKVAPILADATANMYSKPLAPGSQQAYQDTGAMLEGILADPEGADVEGTLESFQSQYDAACQAQ